MPTKRHPVTGVVLNELAVRRKSLAPSEAVTAALLRREGHKLHDIAAMLGTNAARVVEALAPPGASGSQPDLF